MMDKDRESNREKVIDIICEVAMAHHDDMSATDVANASDAADDIISFYREKLLEKMPKRDEKFYGMPEIDAENRGFNSALSQFGRLVDEVLG